VRHGQVFAVAILVAGLLAVTPARAVAQDDPNPGALTISGGYEFLNQYMFRGIRQHSTGMAMWPWFDLGIAAYEGDGGLTSASINFGTWNSLHSGDTGADGPSGKVWYESDFYAALGLGFSGGSFTTTYTAYTSPNNAFSTVKEIMFKLAIDDSAYLGSAALSPYVAIAREFGDAQADGGAEAGTYLEVGIAPGYSGSRASLAVPVKIGVSVGDYYENPVTGDDDKFGYFSIGGVVTVPLGPTTKFGSWNVHFGAEYQRLGDTNAIFNGDEKNRGIVSGGIGFSY
jgi:hypothetical protein